MLEPKPEWIGHKEVVVMMFWSDSHWVFWQVALMWVGMIAFWGLIIWAVYAMFGGDKQVPQHDHRNDDAVHILDGRLAKGEIDTEEYARLRGVIEGARRAPVSAGADR